MRLFLVLLCCCTVTAMIVLQHSSAGSAENITHWFELQDASYPLNVNATQGAAFDLTFTASVVNHGSEGSLTPGSIWLVLLSSDNGTVLWKSEASLADPTEWRTHLPGDPTLRPLSHKLGGSIKMVPATVAAEPSDGTCQSNLCHPCTPPSNGSTGPGTCCNKTWTCFYDQVFNYNLCLPPHPWICDPPSLSTPPSTHALGLLLPDAWNKSTADSIRFANTDVEWLDLHGHVNILGSVSLSH